MKKFILYLITNLTFKKLILPILVKILKLFFTDKTISFLFKHTNFLIRIFKALNALLGFLLFINIFDFSNIFTILGLMNAISTFFWMIIDNFIKVLHKILSPTPVININIEKLESVKKLSDFSKNTSDNYESLRQLYNKPITDTNSDSFLKNYFTYILGVFILMLLGFGLYYFFLGGGSDPKGKSIDTSNLYPSTSGDPFHSEARPGTHSLLGSIRSILSERSHYFRNPDSPKTPSKVTGNTSQLMGTPENQASVVQQSYSEMIMSWMGIKRDKPFTVTGEGEAIPVEMGTISTVEQPVESVTNVEQLTDVPLNTVYSDNSSNFSQHDPYAEVRADVLKGNYKLSLPNLDLTDAEKEILYPNYGNRFDVLADNESTVLYSDSDSASQVSDDIQPFDL